MRIILLLAICLTSFFGFSQKDSDYEDTSYVSFDIYYLLDYSKWSITSFEPEEFEGDSITIVTYSPLTNLEVFDSLINFRQYKGAKAFKVDSNKVVPRMDNSQTSYAMDISKAERSKVIMRQMNDSPDCDCGRSIAELVLDDSLTFGKMKFKDILLEKNIKRINVNYYQVSRKSDPDKKEEHLYIEIKKRFHLFNRIYEIM